MNKKQRPNLFNLIRLCGIPGAKLQIKNIGYARPPKNVVAAANPLLEAEADSQRTKRYKIKGMVVLARK